MMGDPVAQSTDRVERVVNNLAFCPARTVSECFVKCFAPNLIFILWPKQADPKCERELGHNCAIGWIGMVNSVDRFVNVINLGLLQPDG